MPKHTEKDTLEMQLRTLLGQRRGNVSGRGHQEASARATISRQMAANPLLGKEVFGEAKVQTKTPEYFAVLHNKNLQGKLTEAEKSFVREQFIFSDPERVAKFGTLMADAPRLRTLIKAREEVLNERRARPGRTQTILTRRE